MSGDDGEVSGRTRRPHDGSMITVVRRIRMVNEPGHIRATNKTM